jgi:serine O-acetyltransferase
VAFVAKEHVMNNPAPHGTDLVRAVGLRASIREDHRVLRGYQEKYRNSSPSAKDLPIDAIAKIGFQMMVVMRLMFWCRDHRLVPAAAVISRLIRHLYGAEVHYRATVSPGVCIVHGTGLVIGANAVVGPECILFQGVTLGESSDGVSGRIGTPRLERRVHVGPNAVLLGPFTIGAESKIMANTVVMSDVPPGSVVLSLAPSIVARGSRPSDHVSPASPPDGSDSPASSPEHARSVTADGHTGVLAGTGRNIAEEGA